MYAGLISGLDHLNESGFLQDVWNLLLPYFTTEGHEEFKLFIKNILLHS